MLLSSFTSSRIVRTIATSSNFLTLLSHDIHFIQVSKSPPTITNLTYSWPIIYNIHDALTILYIVCTSNSLFAQAKSPNHLALSYKGYSLGPKVMYPLYFSFTEMDYQSMLLDMALGVLSILLSF